MRASPIMCASLALVLAAASAVAAPETLQMPAMPAMPTKEQQAALAAQGARPGDDQMTCQQIGAEMQPYMAPAMPAAQAAGADAQQMQEYAKKREAEEMAKAPANAAMAMASMLPGGGFFAMAQQQRQIAQSQRDMAATKPLQDKMLNDDTALVGQMTPLTQDPRLNRLMQLAEAKCQNAH